MYQNNNKAEILKLNIKKKYFDEIWFSVHMQWHLMKFSIIEEARIAMYITLLKKMILS